MSKETFSSEALAVCEEQRETIKELQDHIESLKIKLEDKTIQLKERNSTIICQIEKAKQTRIKQLVLLETTKKLWNIMNSGQTHRAKSNFHHAATLIIKAEMDELYRAMHYPDLPF